jgi:hypothetical protein
MPIELGHRSGLVMLREGRQLGSRINRIHVYLPDRDSRLNEMRAN